MRGISTVVDATVFLLVLGVAVATLVGLPMVGDHGEATVAGPDRADAIAEHLATGTARVNYSLAPAVRAMTAKDPSAAAADEPPFRRSAHGTLASLLADVAVGSITVDDDPLSASGRDYRRAVVTAIERRIERENASVGVTATWEPYRNAAIAGSVHAGDRPPATADVAAATVTVDAAVPASRESAIAAARERGYEGVANVVADAVVAGLFPPDRTELALRGEYPVDTLVATRYHHASLAFGGRGGAPDGSTDIVAANEALSSALAESLERDLRTQYATPLAAARNVSTGTVTVTVRTWSA